MPKTKKTVSGPTSKYQPKPLNEELFHTLFDILHDGCFEGNYAATAKMLSISVPTARRYAISTPKQRYWNHVLEFAIREVYSSMTRSKHKKIRKRAEKVAGQLARAGLHELREYMEYNEAAQEGAVRALLMIVNEAPGQTITTRELKKPGVSGGYSMKALREAARTLHLDIETEGFGEKKTTHYSMPR